MDTWMHVGLGGIATLVLLNLLRWWRARREAAADAHAELPEPEPAPAPEQRACSNCRHWDLEEGQATLGQHPMFLQAAKVVSPAQMGRVIDYYEKHPCAACADAPAPQATCTTCKGAGFVEQPVYKPSGMPAKATWAEFGACLAKSELTWRAHSCDDFEARGGKLVQLRGRSLRGTAA